MASKLSSRAPMTSEHTDYLPARRQRRRHHVKATSAARKVAVRCPHLILCRHANVTRALSDVYAARRMRKKELKRLHSFYGVCLQVKPGNGCCWWSHIPSPSNAALSPTWRSRRGYLGPPLDLQLSRSVDARG